MRKSDREDLNEMDDDEVIPISPQEVFSEICCDWPLVSAREAAALIAVLPPSTVRLCLLVFPLSSCLFLLCQNLVCGFQDMRAFVFVDDTQFEDAKISLRTGGEMFMLLSKHAQ